MDDIFLLISLLDDLVAASHLQGLLCCALCILCKVPLCRERKTGIELLDAGQFIDFFHHLLVLFFQFLDGFGIWAKAIGFEEVNFCLVKWDILFFLFLLGHLNIFQIILDSNPLALIMQESLSQYIYLQSQYLISRMGNCCLEAKNAVEPEILIARGQKINDFRQDIPIQMIEMRTKQQLAERSKNNIRQLEERDRKIRQYEQLVERLNEVIRNKQLKLKQESMQKIRLRQQLSQAKNRSMIRADINAQQIALNQKQKQIQRQQERSRQRQQKQRIKKEMNDRQRQFQQRQKSVQISVKSVYERKIAQLKQEQERKLMTYKSQIQASQRQISQLNNQIARFKQNEQKLHKQLSDSLVKISSFNQQKTLLQKQLEKQRNSGVTKSKKLEQVRFNQLFQNDIFQDRLYFKQYLTKCLQQRYSMRIAKTKLLFAFDPNNKLNFHKSIDHLPCIIVIVRLANGYYVAGYTQGPFIPKVAANRDALLISLTNQKMFSLIEENRKGITYDDYYIIFGNSQLRLKSQQSKIFSNFGINNGYFANRGESVNTLLGYGNNEREVDIAYYEIYQIFFEFM